ncbi:unnamed protein product [Clonostachys rosea f. rosea IK726]|uniref:Uncharacterized protein n=1 Tax=Clonostachys rosea f. rosea IK726 TaxID=1349383 RepID=A0ACA9UPX3_BIOOC|nr:unnamed protein product [Clonostachys rosea f. rosea IK726]
MGSETNGRLLLVALNLTNNKQPKVQKPGKKWVDTEVKRLGYFWRPGKEQKLQKFLHSLSESREDQESFEQLARALGELQKDNEELQKDNKELQKDNEELKKDNEELKKNNKELKKGNEERQMGNEELEDKIMKLQKKIEQLQPEEESIAPENKAFSDLTSNSPDYTGLLWSGAAIYPPCDQPEFQMLDVATSNALPPQTPQPPQPQPEDFIDRS